MPGQAFPFLFEGTFIEGRSGSVPPRRDQAFPFLFEGTFIEGVTIGPGLAIFIIISLPFRRDFH